MQIAGLVVGIIAIIIAYLFVKAMYLNFDVIMTTLGILSIAYVIFCTWDGGHMLRESLSKSASETLGTASTSESK
jgi:threonine/homoserine/homoserine lactone efflux protein